MYIENNLLNLQTKLYMIKGQSIRQEYAHIYWMREHLILGTAFNAMTYFSKDLYKSIYPIRI